jgi:methylenetetrahydrofolate dehydrogenase (NADP+)/methenyltetrahydrofolate cyclohydrolase/formyltetrahydrofolate synthetase
MFGGASRFLAFSRHASFSFVLKSNKSRIINYYQTTTGKATMAQIISGKEVADEIRAKLKEKVQTLTVKPKLVIVQVGGREDSNVYIRMKMQFAESIGALSELVKLDRDVSETALAQKIIQLNEDTSVHGIITQLPFDCSNKINSDYIVNLIDPKKDVDGLSVYNAGKLSHGELDSSAFVPCTPNGCLELIKKSGVDVAGSRSVVIGRSKIVGSPMAQLLLWNNSTVTICHSKTKNIEEICRQADILVAAVGRAQMVKGSWLKPGAVVIDCGINVIPDATKKSGTRLVGDVDFEDCKNVASAITPVPGGVGPMTVAMLISNTVEAACRASSAS